MYIEILGCQLIPIHCLSFRISNHIIYLTCLPYCMNEKTSRKLNKKYCLEAKAVRSNHIYMIYVYNIGYMNAMSKVKHSGHHRILCWVKSLWFHDRKTIKYYKFVWVNNFHTSQHSISMELFFSYVMYLFSKICIEYHFIPRYIHHCNRTIILKRTADPSVGCWDQKKLLQEVNMML